LHLTGGSRNERSKDVRKLRSSPNGPKIDQSDQAKEFVNENIPILYKPKVHYSVHMRPQLVAILSRTRPFETFTSSFSSIGFKNYLLVVA
jgi:hypothetical protein